LNHRGENYAKIIAVIEVVGNEGISLDLKKLDSSGNSGRKRRKTNSMKSIGG
jgi:hypothetical protein